MPTSGLVISTSHEADLRPVLAALGDRADITCGNPIGGRLPIVTETTNKAEDKALWDWLWKLPGVASVDVAFIHLDDGSDQTVEADLVEPPASTTPSSATAIAEGN